MGEPFRDEQHLTIFGIKVNAKMLKASVRTRSQIDYHVINRACCAADELGFFARRSLVMHASKSPSLCVVRYVALQDPRVETMLFKLTAAVTSCEKAAIVLVPFGSIKKAPLSEVSLKITYDLRLRNRNDELPSPFADERHLANDLILQVPWQNEQVVRTVMADSFG